MGLINTLFGKEKMECPRCLGKGVVDEDDIKRLEKELKWAPGPCAYCNGKGKVPSEILAKIAVDTTYLTSDLPKAEQNSVLANEEGAQHRAKLHEVATDNFIAEVEYLHFTCNIDVQKITGFYLLHKTKTGVYFDSKNELFEYIESVIDRKTN